MQPRFECVCATIHIHLLLNRKQIQLLRLNEVSQAQGKYSSNRRGNNGATKKDDISSLHKTFFCVRKSHFSPGRMALKQEEPRDSKDKK